MADELLKALLSDPKRVAALLSRTLPDDQVSVADVAARLAKLAQIDDPRLELDEQLRAQLQAHGDQDRSEQAKLQEAARGQHTLYSLSARHHRIEPYEADWCGKDCQQVRVTLPQTLDEAEPIWTYLGVVKAADHLLFSVDEMVQLYLSSFRIYRPVERVDLITGARHLDLDRFAPISIFLAYEKSSDTQPAYYMLESGSAQGNPEAIYPARELGDPVETQAGFAFTPFACASNWYTGGLQMNGSKTEPSSVLNSVNQVKDGQRNYLELRADYTVVEPPERVIWPLQAQIEASLRVFALAQGMDVELIEKVVQDLLAACARKIYDWDVEPPRSGPSDGYDGCPE